MKKQKLPPPPEARAALARLGPNRLLAAQGGDTRRWECWVELTEQLMRGQRTRLTVRGELTLATAAEARAHLARACAGGRSLCLDLRELDWLDACGLSLILWAHREAGAGRLTLDARGNRIVGKLLRLTDLERRLHLYGRQAPR